jgi:hypothetical protein
VTGLVVAVGTTPAMSAFLLLVPNTGGVGDETLTSRSSGTPVHRDFGPRKQV